MTQFVKPLTLVATALTAFALVQTASADTVTLYQLPAYSYSDGGEFTTVTNPTLDTTAYSSLTKNVPSYANSFETFCVENNTYFTPGTNYNYTLGQTIPQIPGGPKLTTGVAWLYQQFASGVLADYYYSSGDTGGHYSSRSLAAGVLQQTIWYLQGETGGALADHTFLNLLTSTGAGGAGFATLSAAEAAADVTNTFGVQVMQLTDKSSGVDAQDQLYLGPTINPNLPSVPDGGSTVALLGMALGGIGALSKRKSA